MRIDRLEAALGAYGLSPEAVKKLHITPLSGSQYTSMEVLRETMRERSERDLGCRASLLLYLAIVTTALFLLTLFY